MKTTGVGSLQDRQVTKEGPTPVSARVSPTERIRARVDELFAEDRPLPEVLEEVARLGAQLLMQAALEAEVTEFLGRDRYQRAAACDQSRDAAATATGRCRSRQRPGRWSWPGPSCVAPPRSSPLGSSARTLPRPTRWSRW